MIKAERLKELIESSHSGHYNAVWIVGKNKQEIRIGLDRSHIFVEDNELKWSSIINKLLGSKYINLKDIYETKSEAEFVAKYKNITRTETLDLPTWEEVKSNKRHDLTIFYRNHNEIQFYIKNNIYIVRFGFDGDINFIFKDEKTKENYLEACEVCKKLFIGEVSDVKD